MSSTGVSGGPVTTTSPGQWLMCRVGDRVLAVAMACVGETMRPLPLRAFPGAPEYVLGVAVIRGAVVPVIDLESVLAAEGARTERFVTITLQDRTVALAVDAVIGTRCLDDATLQAVPALLGGLDRDTLSAVGTLDAGLLLVLGQARLLPESAWAALDEQAGSAEQGGAARPAGAVPAGRGPS